MNKEIFKIIDENGNLSGISYDGVHYIREEGESPRDFYYSVENEIGKEEFENSIREILKNNNNQGIPTITNEEYENLYTSKQQNNFKKGLKRKPKSVKKGNAVKKVVAGALATLILAGSAYGIIKLKNKNNQQGSSSSSSSSQQGFEENENVLTLEAASQMSYEQLLVYLNDGIQRTTVETWNLVQDQFNNQEALSIKIEEDGEKQLYLKAEEVMALHAFLNSYNYSTEDFIEVYSGSKLFQAGVMKENYRENILEVMFKYSCRATQIPSDYMLSSSAEGQNLIKEYWNLVVSYNTATDEEKEAKGEAMLNFFKKLYDEDKYNIDSITTTNPGEAEYVLSLGVPYMEATGILRDDMVIEGYHDKEKNMSFKALLQELDGTLYYTTTYNNKLLAVEEAINNDDLINQQKIITEADGTFKLVENRTVSAIAMSQIPRALNEKNIRAKDRNIEIIFGDRSFEANAYYGGASLPGQNISTTTQDRNEAVNIAGEAAVKEAENKANQEVAEKNKSEEARAAGMQVGYNITYQASFNLAFETGVAYGISSYDSQIAAIIASNQGQYGQHANSFATGVREGAAAGIAMGEKDGLAAREKANAMNNSSSSKPQTPVNPFEPDINNGEERDPEYQTGSSSSSPSSTSSSTSSSSQPAESDSSSSITSSSAGGNTTTIIPDMPPLPKDEIVYENPFINANAEASQDAGYRDSEGTRTR